MKKNIITTIIQGMAVTALFLVTEIVLNLFGVFNDDIRLYLVDISLLFGQGVIATLWQVFHCFLWGFFAAAIYMLSKNLTLLMVMHAVWDIVIRIPDNFCNFAGNSVLRDALYILQDVLDYGIMPIAAVYICIRYEKLRGRNQEEREAI